jgi:hypothetical protein
MAGAHCSSKLPAGHAVVYLDNMTTAGADVTVASRTGRN